MAMQNWKSFLMPYEQAVDELKVKLKSIRKEYRKRNEYSPIEFVTGRVKEVSSLLEKANKFEIPLDRVGEEMEDIAGIRIMCQFVDDIDTVIELIRARKDMQILYEKDYVRNVKQSGYRSYHVIINYPINSIAGYKDKFYKVNIPKVNAINPVGSGDSYVGGIAVALQRGYSIKDMLKYASACGTANAMEEETGFVTKNVVEDLLSKISVTII